MRHGQCNVSGPSPVFGQKIENWREGISFIIPTFKRPLGLRTALNAVNNQIIDMSPIEIIIVDNDPDASAKDFVEGFELKSLYPIQYIHCPEPGVSNARNAGMAHRRGRYVIFLDDDMDASPDWAQSMINTGKSLSASIVFGPIHARMPGMPSPKTPYLASFFSRSFPETDDAYLSKTFGTGGCFIDTASYKIPNPPFDLACNETGGEDDLFFDSLIRQGARMAWSPKAVCYEVVPTDRATPEYIYKRSFGFGQGTTRTMARRGIRGITGVLWFTCTGTIQCVMYGLTAICLGLLKKPKHIKFLALSIQGLGKIFWSHRIAPQFYGVSRLAKTTK
jgi:succinoglycan biosynthesis protein ExoM